MSDTTFPPTPKTEDLLRDVRAGDARAWEQLYGRYRQMLIATVRARIPGFARRSFDAEDVLQSAFSTVWSRIKTFEYRGEGSFRRWIRTIVINEFVDQLKGHDRGLVQPLETRDLAELSRKEGREKAPSEVLRAEEESASLYEAMGRLDEVDRELVTLHYLEQKKIKEVAEIMGWHRNGARRRIADAMSRLERLL